MGPGAAGRAWAEPAPAGAVEIDYRVSSQDLRGLVTELVSAAGLAIENEIGTAVRVNTRRLRGPLANVLDELAREYGLVWVSTGAVIHVGDASRSVSRTLEMSTGDLRRVRETMLALNLETRPDLVRLVPSAGRIEVSGPPRFVEVVAERLGRPREKAEAGDDIRVIRFGKTGTSE
jgi:type III secretion protein C